MGQSKYAKNQGRPCGQTERVQRRLNPRNKEHPNDNEEEQALIFNEHAGANHDEQSQDVMNVTFNRSSAITNDLFIGNQSPKPCELEDSFFSVVKKDSLKLSFGSYEAFDQIKEGKPQPLPEETKNNAKPEKKRKKKNQMLKLSPRERQRQRRELSASPEQQIN